jgi:CheY-like chemotaxis protein
VLIVDDNEDAAMMLAELLELVGFEVKTAHDGPSALATLHTFEPETAVLDIGLPVMDGFEVARRIRAHSSLGRIQIVALTGYGQADDHARSAAAGFDHHLTKPVDVSRLVELLGTAQPRG